MGGVADESPDWIRQDQHGPWGTRTVTLVPGPATRPDGGEAIAQRRTRRRVAIGLDRLIWYATCNSDGEDIGQLILISSLQIKSSYISNQP